MKKILFLLFPIISFAQSESEIKALDFQNTIRFYNFLDPLAYCDTLSTNAQEWAEHLAKTDNLRVSKDVFGENVYSVKKISKTIMPNFNHAVDAAVFWVTTNEDALEQIINPEATKIGFGISENKYKYFIVAKYNNIIE